MNSLKSTLLLLPALLLATSPLLAQDKKPRVSPQDTVKATIDGDEITIVYSRPYTKDPKTGEPRKIWGGLVPYGKVWRLGANEATVLTTKEKIDLAGTEIPAGSYSLFLQPEEDGTAKLIVNKETGQWGTKYDAGKDLLKIDLKKEATAKPVDQFTITLEDKKDGGGELKMMWENTEFAAPIKVKK